MRAHTNTSTPPYYGPGDRSAIRDDECTSVRRISPRGKIIWIIICAALLAVALFSACSENLYNETDYVNKPPTIQLVHGPEQEYITVYQVHFYWMGYDTDGCVEHYEYVFTSGDPIGFDPADTTGLNKWTSTDLTDIEFTVSADEMDTTITIAYNTYARFRKTHTFFVRAVDDKGMRSEATYRSFTAFTLAPSIFITEPPPEPTVDTQFLTPVIIFKWEGKDPIDSPWNYQEVDSVRYMYSMYYGRLMEDLNKRPEMFDERWSPWVAFEAPADSGKSTILGDDEILEFNRAYVFVVQAMDEAGAISAIFDERTNVRRFMIKEPTGPLLEVREMYLGTYNFVGTEMNPLALYTPAGFALNFKWYGNASDYGAFVATYRFGWDIKDLSDPNQWEVRPAPHHREAPQRRFLSGVHSLFIEAVDNIGVPTLAQIDITVVPLSMDRDLLWVDDFPSDDFIQVSYAVPTESQHDNFWIEICSRARRFDPDIDIYDTMENNYQTPDLRRLWRYKNVIWTYGTARWDFNTWIQTVNFTPEQALDQLGGRYTYNILQFYMLLGGHLWSCGRSDKSGGMAGCNPAKKIGPWDDIMTRNLIFPLYLRCETITGPRGGCPDTAGVNAMPWKDFCVSVLDKVYGVWRRDGTVPERKMEWDALRYVYRDQNDPLTLAHPDLPEELHLWEEVTKPGRFFDPMVRGMHYVEIYDPKYWMRPMGIPSRSCFHPMYRMRTINTKSAVDHTVIAFWSTVHADVVSDAPGTVAAASVHMGIPLWYFDHDGACALADAIFAEWQIKGD